MREMRFGVAGLKDYKDVRASVDDLVKRGFTACEVQFVKEFTLKEPEAKLLGELARDADIRLSVHAPYFAQLTAKEPSRLKLHFGGLHHSAKLGALMGAHVITCHPGSRGDASADELLERVDKNLETLGPRIADTGVRLGLETAGRKSQFGSLGDIAMLVKRHAFTTVVVDYGHIHAVSSGSLNNAQAFDALFSYITSNFSDEHLWPLHTHFSDNEWGDAGERRHVTYGGGTLRIANVIEGVRRHSLCLTVISEHKEDGSHEAILGELKSSGAPLITRGGAPVETRPLPVQQRGEVHVFTSGDREVRITNIDKVLFPDDGITKGDLAAYYYNAAPAMLPFLRDRPVNMQRVPSGIYGEAFYEKQRPKGAPEWVRTVPIPSDSGSRIIDFVVVDDVSTLVWLAQIASVECHAWTSKWPDLDQPDFAVLDLDPHEPIEFEDVRAVAKLVDVVLQRLGIKGFPKTSGGSGIQVFIPLAPGHTYQQVRKFCSAVGGLIRSAYPEKVTLEVSKPKRAGKVFIDANQNAKSKTLVAPYSVRPYPGAPVSTPLSWDDLDDEFYPEEFTIRSVPKRMADRGDLFRPALSIKHDLTEALSKLEA